MKGIMNILIVFTIFIFVGISYFFLLSPMAMSFLTASAEAGEEIIQSTLNNIQDTTLNDTYYETLSDAQSSIAASASTIRYNIKYSWLIFALGLTFAMFVLSRFFVNTSNGGGGGGWVV